MTAGKDGLGPYHHKGKFAMVDVALNKNNSVMIAPSEMTPALPDMRATDSADDDSRLMVLIGAGDEGAFKTLMDRHMLRAVRQAARLIGNDSQAEDIAQEAFVRVWRHADRWQETAQRGARFSTWLYKIILNLVIDEKRKRQTVAIDSIAEPADDRQPGAEDMIVRQQRAAEVQAALRQLPDRQREAFVLCFFEEYSNRDAAELLDVSVKALESLLVRARRSLRELLTKESPL